MEDHTIALLQECSQGCKMGIKSMNQVMDYVSDGELRRIIDRSKADHRKIESEADNLLARLGQHSKQPEMMATAMSWISTEMKMMMDSSDEKVADLMYDGCNMGVKSLYKYLNQYEDADKDSKRICKTLINIEEKSLLGFCVMGGIFSEGIDLKQDSLIGVIIVGTGLPMVCAERMGRICFRYCSPLLL